MGLKSSVNDRKTSIENNNNDNNFIGFKPAPEIKVATLRQTFVFEKHCYPLGEK